MQEKDKRIAKAYQWKESASSSENYDNPVFIKQDVVVGRKMVYFICFLNGLLLLIVGAVKKLSAR